MEPGTIPYCGAPPLPHDLWTRWNPDPVLAAVLVLAFAALTRAGGRPAPLWAGFALLAVLFVSPLCALTSALFSARTVHHLLLVELVAPCLALALPRGGRALPSWTLAQAVVVWIWHAPPAYALALANDGVYWLMQASMLAVAVGFWRAVLAASAPAAGAALLATMVQMGLLGALLAFAGRAIYAFHWTTVQPWGLSPREDQQLAGLIMWVPGAGAYLLAALALTGAWLSRRERAMAA
ncbi:cytochrome c oxidase assembly protein [Novosphingobium soli]|uniref:Cytochrome c oxidase assembly protein n=1 Tax=Novosphingobium soli TaxID=574956 RepID=A0ABV6CZN3_9SPHN